jgi:hypothetical protein
VIEFSGSRYRWFMLATTGTSYLWLRSLRHSAVQIGCHVRVGS